MKYLIIILLLAGCKTTRNVQKLAHQIDSTGFFKRDTVRVLRTDSVHTDTDHSVSVEDAHNDYEEWSVTEEYKDTPVVRKTTVHIRDKGVRNSKVVVVSKDSTGVKRTDSAAAHNEGAAVVKTLEKSKEIAVKKTQGGVWINLIILLAVAAAGYWAYRKYIKPRLS
jgi:hypothetical protein